MNKDRDHIQKQVEAFFLPAIANKATEEGELPELPQEIEVGGEGWDFEDFKSQKTFSVDHMHEYARQAIAADRASRQVANKAEVDLSSLQRYRDLGGFGVTEWETGAYVKLADVENLLATPPATTGASTARDEILEEAAEAIDALNDSSGDAAAYDNREQNLYELEREHAISACAEKVRALKGSVGASTVLTDEPQNGIAATHRHDEGAIARCSYCGRYSLDPATLSDRQPACECGKQHGWSGSFKKPEPDSRWSGKAPAAREVAAQAGQVAVPGWISTDDRLPENGKDVIILYWPYNNHENERVAGTAHHVEGTFYDEDGNDMHPPSHWMPFVIPEAAPSPAKESK